MVALKDTGRHLAASGDPFWNKCPKSRAKSPISAASSSKVLTLSCHISGREFVGYEGDSRVRNLAATDTPVSTLLSNPDKT
jgi:hypothetical protein